MSLLQEYLDRRREEREMVKNSPELLLNRIASATEKTASHADIIGGPKANDRARSIGSIDAEELAEQGAESLKIQESTSYGVAEISVQQEKMLDTYKKTSKNLLESIDRLTKATAKGLAALKPKPNRHEKKENPAFQRPRDKNGRFISYEEAARRGSGGSLIDDALDLFGNGNDRGRRRRIRGRGGRGRAGTLARSAEGIAENVGTLGRIRGWFGGMKDSAVTASRDLIGKGSSWLGGAKDSIVGAGEGLWGKAKGLFSSGAAGEAGAAGGSALKSLKGIGLGKAIGGVAGTALAGLDAYSILTDDNNKDKTRDMAKLGGSVAGGAIGATLGSFAGPVGTVAGGAAGAWLGDKVGGGIVDAGRYVADSKAGEFALKPFMVGMNAIEAIWSKDARATLADTFKNDIIPGFESAGSAIKDAASTMGTALASFASGVWTTMKGWVGMAPQGQGQSIGSRISSGMSSMGDSAARAYASLTGNVQSVGGAPRALGALDMKAMQQKTYNDALGMREGGGGYNAVNKYGYMGKYQFGKDALKDLGYIDKKSGQWTGKNGVNSQQDFINNHSAQDAANTDFAKLNWQKLNASPIKYDANGKPVYARDMVGQKIGGQTISESGLMGAAHLGGAGSVSDFLRSNGKNVAVDANGVPITNYMTTMGGKDVSNITGKASYQGKIDSFQFTGNENTYIPTSKGKQYVQFANLTGNNAIDAKVANGTVRGTGPQMSDQQIAQVKPVETTTPKVAQAKVRNVRTEAPSRPTRASTPEVKKVEVANAQELRADGTPKTVAQATQTPQLVNSVPTLDSMPTYIDDAGLMALNMGFI